MDTTQNKEIRHENFKRVSEVLEERPGDFRKVVLQSWDLRKDVRR
jgi:hypothetical protein